jgi:ubiquinone/menaquinone biosynthesis C-methylase UbiE
MLPLFPSDRRCRPRTLDNPLRRRFAPATRELDLLSLASGQTVADLGAGVGFFGPEILRRVGPRGRLYLVDPDAGNLARAAARVGPDPRVHILQASAARVEEIPDGSVDCVLLSLVLCCMVDKEGALNEAWRIIRPSGRCYASYPRRSLVPRFRRPSLRVTPERWEALARLHPWRAIRTPPSWVVTRHLLERPA